MLRTERWTDSLFSCSPMWTSEASATGGSTMHYMLSDRTSRSMHAGCRPCLDQEPPCQRWFGLAPLHGLLSCSAGPRKLFKWSPCAPLAIRKRCVPIDTEFQRPDGRTRRCRGGAGTPPALACLNHVTQLAEMLNSCSTNPSRPSSDLTDVNASLSAFQLQYGPAATELLEQAR